MTIMQEKFILIDGNSLANRAFYAIPMLSNSKGFITNAIYGFCNMLFRVIEEEKPQYIAVAFDKGKIVFRHEDYSQYKAHRKGTPEELRPQFPILKELLHALNIAVFEAEGYEADDIIGTLACQGDRDQLEVIILTGDRDALQLISPNVRVYLTKKGITELEKYDEHALKEKYGLTPVQMIDLKGLMGDASDNIPGIPGVGEKTALKLVQEYGNLENVLANSGNFHGKKLGILLEEYKDQAILSKKLATINCEVSLEDTALGCSMKEPDYEKAIELLKELEFKNILQDMLDKSKKAVGDKTPHGLEVKGTVIDDPGLLEAKLLEGLDGLCLHISAEKTGPTEFRIAKIGLKPWGEEPISIHWQDKDFLKEFINILRPYLEQESIKKTVHDNKAVSLFLKSYGIDFKGAVYDTLLMSYLLNPSRTQLDLNIILQEYLNLSLPEEADKNVFCLLDGMERLGQLMDAELKKQEMWKLYNDLELPLSSVLAKMEQSGVCLDKDILIEMGKDFDLRIDELTKKIYELSGEEYNINSPRQLGLILFDKLGLPRGKKTKTGYSTSAEVLELLAPDHEVVAKVLEYRQMIKLKSTYIDGLQNIMEPVKRKVYTSLNQAVTATGRLSSTEPNLQNIPIRMEEGRRIRRAFIPSPGNLLISADYSQIELRVLAHIAKDEVLLEAFKLDQDIHTRTASEVFGVPMDAVNKEMRRAAKAVNFGIVYGISDFGLSQDLRITRREAKEYIDSYFQRYSGVKRYIEGVIEEARENGYVTTLLNRRRYLPDILSSNFHLRSFAERTAMNTPIQGSAADIIKLAMLRLQKIIEEKDLELNMILQVHDELIFDVPRIKVDEIGTLVNKIMSEAYPLLIPLKVDLQTGPNWHDMKPLILK